MFENFLLASGASDFKPERRKALLIHSLGVEGQRIFSSLLLTSDAAQSGESAAGGKRSKESGDTAQPSVYDEAIETLKQHFTSTSNVVAERHRFRRRMQQPGESVQEYVAALRALAVACSYVSLEDSLRDQFVEGVASQHLRERLLLEGSTLSFPRAVALASQVEQANEDIREFASGNVQRISGHSRLALYDHRSTGTRHPPRNDASLREPRTEASLQHDSRQPASYLRPYNSSSRCYRCGSRQHRAASPRCPAQGQRCYHCGLIGHFSAVCNKKRRAVAVRELSEQTLPDNETLPDSETDNEAVSILCVTASGRAGILVEVAVGHTTLTFLIDSGSSVSILAGDLFDKHFAEQVLLSAPRVQLLDYSKKPIPVRGCFLSKVSYKEREASILFYVVSQGTSLLGIDAIMALDFQIDGSSLRCLETTTSTSSATDVQVPVQEPVSSARLPAQLRNEFACLFDSAFGLANGLYIVSK
ncbi:uncharacterized protein [Dermacentor andersoni]|uniref:uncharacterized protein n=1 Tax=Dermacentor andersoni TaxID=34620 RepID=UPI002155BB7E|nr:uncharacterized protein LOC126534723 [Dermacentor andersoni]